MPCASLLGWRVGWRAASTTARLSVQADGSRPRQAPGLPPEGGRRHNAQIEPHGWAGQVVWAKLAKYPWWPAQVSRLLCGVHTASTAACPTGGMPSSSETWQDPSLSKTWLEPSIRTSWPLTMRLYLASAAAAAALVRTHAKFTRTSVLLSF
jgi:PWWP domain